MQQIVFKFQKRIDPLQDEIVVMGSGLPKNWILIQFDLSIKV
jgi:hypothetical protein